MKVIYTNKGEPILVDDADFEELSRWSWRLTANGYAARTIYVPELENRIGIEYMHRRLLGLKRGNLAKVDHRDRNKQNNQRSNLRIATTQQNGANAKRPVHNKSGFKGVFFDSRRRKWTAYIHANSSNEYLGLFDTREAAHSAYRKAAAAHFGEFANPG